MKRTLLPLLALLAAPLAANAQTLDLGSHGKFSITVPTGWTCATQKMEDTGYTLTLSSPGNAKCILTLVYIADPQPVTKERVDDAVLATGDQFVDGSVEKKKVLREFSVPGAYGSYSVFTDATMVGKPVQKDSFKQASVGVVAFSDDLSMSASMGFDDEKGPEFEAMLAAINSARVSKQK